MGSEFPAQFGEDRVSLGSEAGLEGVVHAHAEIILPAFNPGLGRVAHLIHVLGGHAVAFPDPGPAHVLARPDIPGCGDHGEIGPGQEAPAALRL